MKNKKKSYGLIAGVTLLALATPFIGASIAKADTLQTVRVRALQHQ